MTCSVRSYPILSYLFGSRPILSYPILSCPILPPSRFHYHRHIRLFADALDDAATLAHEPTSSHRRHLDSACVSPVNAKPHFPSILPWPLSPPLPSELPFASLFRHFYFLAAGSISMASSEFMPRRNPHSSPLLRRLSCQNLYGILRWRFAIEEYAILSAIP